MTSINRFDDIQNKYDRDLQVTNLVNAVTSVSSKPEEVKKVDVKFKGNKWVIGSTEVKIDQSRWFLFIRRIIHAICLKCCTRYRNIFIATVAQIKTGVATYKAEVAQIAADNKKAKEAAEKQKKDAETKAEADKKEALEKKKEIEDKITAKNDEKEKNKLVIASKEKEKKEIEGKISDVDARKTAKETELKKQQTELTEEINEYAKGLVKPNQEKNDLIRYLELLKMWAWNANERTEAEQLKKKLTGPVFGNDVKNPDVKMVETKIESKTIEINKITTLKTNKEAELAKIDLEAAFKPFIEEKAPLLLKANAKTDEIKKLKTTQDQLEKDLVSLSTDGAVIKIDVIPEVPGGNALEKGLGILNAKNAGRIGDTVKAPAFTVKHVQDEIRKISGGELVGLLKILFDKVNEEVIEDFKIDSTGRCEIKLKKPLRLWVKSQEEFRDKKKITYVDSPKGGTILLLGDNPDRKVVMKLEKNSIMPESGFEAYCRIPDKFKNVKGILKKAGIFTEEYIRPQIKHIEFTKKFGDEAIGCFAAVHIPKENLAWGIPTALKLAGATELKSEHCLEMGDPRFINLKKQSDIWNEGHLVSEQDEKGYQQEIGRNLST